MKKNFMNIIFSFMIILLIFSCKKNVKILNEEEKAKEIKNLADKTNWLNTKNINGSSSVRIISDKVIYIDPVDITDEMARTKADIILVTHEHDDHFDYKSILKLRKNSTVLISIPSIIKVFSGGKFKKLFKLKPITANERIIIDNIIIEATPAYNSNHPKTLGNIGFIINLPGGIRYYISGDTDYIPEMNNIKNIDIAVLYVSYFNLDGKEAVDTVKQIQPKIAIPVHWTDVEKKEVDFIKQNISASTKLMVLEKK